MIKKDAKTIQGHEAQKARRKAHKSTKLDKKAKVAISAWFLQSFLKVAFRRIALDHVPKSTTKSDLNDVKIEAKAYKNGVTKSTAF